MHDISDGHWGTVQVLPKTSLQEQTEMEPLLSVGLRVLMKFLQPEQHLRARASELLDTDLFVQSAGSKSLIREFFVPPSSDDKEYFKEGLYEAEI